MGKSNSLGGFSNRIFPELNFNKKKTASVKSIQWSKGGHKLAKTQSSTGDLDGLTMTGFNGIRVFHFHAFPYVVFI